VLFRSIDATDWVADKFGFSPLVGSKHEAGSSAPEAAGPSASAASAAAEVARPV
jgi:hypothetical protein